MAARRILALASACALQGCIVSTVVSTAVDVGVDVVQVPIKAGKTVYDAATSDKEKKNQENGVQDDKSDTSSAPSSAANVSRHP